VSQLKRLLKLSKRMKKNKKSFYYQKICVIGLGYIGLPTACFLAKAGYKVIGFDLNQGKIKSLKQKTLPFEEPGLDDLFKKAFKNMTFSSKIEPADVFIISVPTPVIDKKKPDLSFVKKATKDINKVLKDKNLIIIESTVPPGTAKKVVIPILRRQHKKLRIYLTHAPERAIPGKTLKEMIKNKRIIGGIDKKSTNLAKKIYSSFVKGKIYLTDSTTAEFVKLIENTFRDINIAFANELVKICDYDKINAWEAISLANLHPRVFIHQPGPGVGGHCISIDPWFLINKANNNGTEFIKLSREINDLMPKYVVKNISKMLEGIKNPGVTILGVAYKPNVDDWRETPALKIIDFAKNKGWQIKIHDPLVKNFPYKIERNFEKAIEGSDCLVLVANHNCYKKINPAKIKNMRTKKIFDARNFINKKEWQEAGFDIKILGNI